MIINLEKLIIDPNKKDRYTQPGIVGMARFLLDTESIKCPYPLENSIIDGITSACGIPWYDEEASAAVMALFHFFKAEIWQNHTINRPYHTIRQPMSEESLNKRLCFMSKVMSAIASQDPDYFSPEMHSEKDAFAALKEFTTALKNEGYNFFEK